MTKAVIYNKRIVWIDIAKGIGIMLVVIGHLHTTTWVHDGIFLFHMPLFFLLSGILFKPADSWTRCMYGKFLHLIVPYAFFAVLLIPVRYVTDWFCTGEWQPLRLSMLGLSYFDKPLWFVFALFVVIGIMQTLFLFIKIKWSIVILILTMSIAGYLLLFNKIELPAHISRALFVLPFFALGPLLKKYGFHNTSIFLLICLLCLAWGICEQGISHISLNVLAMQADPNPLFVYLPAIGGSMFVILLAKGMYMLQQICKEIGGANHTFEYIGRNSFYIFAVHHPIICFINSIFYNSMEEPTFKPIYFIMLLVLSVMISLLVGSVLKKMVPQIFR